jgi:uncharacterized repeat protein (TIGR03837 family)
MKASWDIFCSVVDNYGDIGVTWRLARQLVAEHDLQVRLWVDDLASFTPLCPAADPQLAQQWQEGVDVRQWPSVWQAVELPDVVIEAFACKLPVDYVDAMARSSPVRLWLNLDYLSAEDWVGGCHGLPSLKTAGYQKYFFFPGFQADTGGLLREAGLLDARSHWQADPDGQQAFLAQWGVHVAAESRLMSLFAYEHPQVPGWLQALAEDSRPTHLLVPRGRVLGDVEGWLREGPLLLDQPRQRGALTLQLMPFVSQTDYDRLLWCCDFNAVRGEDSFVRAQWAGRPLVWHIYKQEEYAHWEKLEAFLTLYTQGLSAAAETATLNFWRAWNMEQDISESWRRMLANWPELLAHAQRWSDEKARQADLAMALVQFHRNWL